MTRRGTELAALGSVLLVLLGVVAGLSLSVRAHSPADVLDAIREVRIDSIRADETLQATAQARAAQLVTDFDHDATFIDSRLPDTWTWGEIIAWNAYPDDIAALAVVEQWADSPDHRGTLLGDWTAVGVGTAEVGDRNYYVALFALIPSSTPARTTAPRPAPTLGRAPSITLPPTDTRP